MSNVSKLGRTKLIESYLFYRLFLKNLLKDQFNSRTLYTVLTLKCTEISNSAMPILGWLQNESLRDVCKRCFFSLAILGLQSTLK
jgi:hypothetical protein